MATFEEELERFRKPIRRLTDLALFPKKVVIRGEENWVRQGANIIVGNHIGSYKDVGLLLRVAPRPIFFTANEELFDYETFADVLDRIPYFIEEVYNRKRLHSALGYLSTINFETPALIGRNRE